MRAALALILAAVLAAAAVASELELDAGDGWYTWRVASFEDAPDWCCTTWSRGRSTPKSCELDSRRFGLSGDFDTAPETGEMQIYAKLVRGEVRSIRTLSPTCPVTADSEIRDLGFIDTNDSLDWLSTQLTSTSSDDALMAISVHDGRRPVQMLIDIVKDQHGEPDLREHALFWLVQSNSDLAYDYLDRLLTSSSR